jgi:hypothetical protein
MGERTQVLWFALDRGWYSNVQVGLSVLARAARASIADDYNRASGAATPWNT